MQKHAAQQSQETHKEQTKPQAIGIGQPASEAAWMRGSQPGSQTAKLPASQAANQSAIWAAKQSRSQLAKLATWPSTRGSLQELPKLGREYLPLLYISVILFSFVQPFGATSLGKHDGRMLLENTIQVSSAQLSSVQFGLVRLQM